MRDFLAGFFPVSALWEGEQAPYPSQQSALWALRKMRAQLAQAGALALHRGRTMVHLEKLTRVVEQTAIERAKKRYCEGA